MPLPPIPPSSSAWSEPDPHTLPPFAAFPAPLHPLPDLPCLVLPQRSSIVCAAPYASMSGPAQAFAQPATPMQLQNVLQHCCDGKHWCSPYCARVSATQDYAVSGQIILSQYQFPICNMGIIILPYSRAQQPMARGLNLAHEPSHLVCAKLSLGGRASHSIFRVPDGEWWSCLPRLVQAL